MSAIVTQDVSAVLSPVSGWDGVLDVVEARVTLDESRSPYVEAELTVHSPGANVELVDPRHNQRLKITLSQSWLRPTRSTQSRTFDLILHERTIDHADGTVTLVAYSDEARLIDGGLVANSPDTSAVQYQKSLRAILDNVVLADFGAKLSSGSDDANFTIVEDGDNLYRNPRGYLGLDFFTTTSPAGNTMVQEATSASDAGTAVKITQGADGAFRTGQFFGPADNPGGTDGLSVREGEVYFLSFDVQAPANSSDVIIEINYNDPVGWVNAGGISVRTTWNRVTKSFQVPKGATSINRIHLLTGSWPVAGNVWRVSRYRLDVATDTVGDPDIQYFDGGTSSPYYVHTWEGDPHLSVSHRQPTNDRDPNAIVLFPGEAYWDYVQPLFEQAGLRLFCDEARVWRLVNASGYSVPGEVRLTDAVNITRASDTIARIPGTYFDSVVVAYKGSDPVRYDSAGGGGTITKLVEWDSPFPGMGAAKSILSRSAGRGRTLDLAALSDLTVTPGVSVVVSLPDPTPIQSGVVSSVTWTFSAEGGTGEMELGTRGLTDTPDSAWALAEGTWADQPVGTSWNEYQGGSDPADPNATSGFGIGSFGTGPFGE